MALRALDLEFMRPKFMVVRLGLPWLPQGGPTEVLLERDVQETVDILHRNGFVAHEDSYINRQGQREYCGDSDARFRCVWATRANVIELGWEHMY